MVNPPRCNSENATTATLRLDDYAFTRLRRRSIDRLSDLDGHDAKLSVGWQRLVVKPPRFFDNEMLDKTTRCVDAELFADPFQNIKSIRR